jgi:hypothetical protein
LQQPAVCLPLPLPLLLLLLRWLWLLVAHGVDRGR